MITTLDPPDLDTIRGLRLALHEHHAAMPTPFGHVVRDADEAWVAWRAAVAPVLAAATGMIFVHRNEADELDGMAYVRRLDVPRRPVVEPVGGHGELVTLIVADASRGHGVGEALTHIAERWCREQGLGTMHIAVRSGNDGALRFYRRHGAVPTWETLLVRLDQPTV